MMKESLKTHPLTMNFKLELKQPKLPIKEYPYLKVNKGYTLSSTLETMNQLQLRIALNDTQRAQQMHLKRIGQVLL